jgi:CRP-like cAMP-binding protein
MGSNFADLQPDVQSLGTVRDFVEEFIEVLKKQPGMRHFSSQELTLLAEYMDCFGVPRNSTVIHEGDDSDFLTILITGEAQVIKHDGVEETVARIISPGELVGEMSMLDGQSRYASCVTSEPSDFAVLTHQKLNDMLADHPRLGNKFLLMLLGLSTSRLRSALTEDHSFGRDSSACI